MTFIGQVFIVVGGLLAVGGAIEPAGLTSLVVALFVLAGFSLTLAFNDDTYAAGYQAAMEERLRERLLNQKKKHDFFNEFEEDVHL